MFCGTALYTRMHPHRVDLSTVSEFEHIARSMVKKEIYGRKMPIFGIWMPKIGIFWTFSFFLYRLAFFLKWGRQFELLILSQDLPHLIHTLIRTYTYKHSQNNLFQSYKDLSLNIVSRVTSRFQKSMWQRHRCQNLTSMWHRTNFVRFPSVWAEYVERSSFESA